MYTKKRLKRQSKLKTAMHLIFLVHWVNEYGTEDRDGFNNFDDAKEFENEMSKIDPNVYMTEEYVFDT